MFIIESGAFGEREDAAAYFIEGEQVEVEAFKLYALSLALGAMVTSSVALRLREDLGAAKSVVTNASVESFHRLFADEHALVEQKQRRLYQDATRHQLTILYDQELTLLEEGAKLSKTWLDSRGYVSQLHHEGVTTHLKPKYNTFEAVQSLGLDPEYVRPLERTVSESGATHMVERYILNTLSNPGPSFRKVVQSPEPHVAYGILDDDRIFQPVTEIPPEYFLNP